MNAQNHASAILAAPSPVTVEEHVIPTPISGNPRPYQLVVASLLVASLLESLRIHWQTHHTLVLAAEDVGLTFVRLLNPTNWFGAVLGVVVLLLLHLQVQRAALRLVGAHPIRRGWDVGGPGVWMSKPQYVAVILAPIVIVWLSGVAVMVGTKPVEWTVRPLPTPLALDASMTLAVSWYFSRCAQNLRTLRTVLKLPSNYRLEDLRSGYRCHSLAPCDK